MSPENSRILLSEYTETSSFVSLCNQNLILKEKSITSYIDPMREYLRVNPRILMRHFVIVNCNDELATLYAIHSIDRERLL